MDMEERYRLIISSILNAIGFRVDVERMMANGRIDIIASSNIYICNRTKTEEQRRNGSCKETNYHKPILGTFQGRQAKSDRAYCRIG